MLAAGEDALADPNWTLLPSDPQMWIKRVNLHRSMI